MGLSVARLAGRAGAAGAACPEAAADRVLSWWLPSEIRTERDRLPWRSPPVAPWAVLVSETMLSQTQAARVAQRYPHFISRFATPAALASAPLGEVLRAWQGLGYPRRAAGLHRSAGAIVAEHGGEVPSDLRCLLALPGVGRYIARAVLAFAFGEATMPVDTNIGRVLARVVGRRLSGAEAQAIGDALLGGGMLAIAPPDRPDRAPGAAAAALAFMDLGATLCRPAAPRCPECPLQTDCNWAQAAASGGEILPDPARGSAGVSRAQARFEGSDRQGRGRLLRAAAAGRVAPAELAAAAAWPDDPARAERVAATLVAEGLLSLEDGFYGLP
ncbi:MAG TPA: A/G-specific adenine glycosylase [Acidimicrobiales bacterium]|nr:A/G-specific adenine glycosylase [Acidimicrobiales bacterium]